MNFLHRHLVLKFIIKIVKLDAIALKVFLMVTSAETVVMYVKQENINLLINYKKKEIMMPNN